MSFNGYPIVILIALIFFGKEFSVTGNSVSSAKTRAVFLKLGIFSNISPIYFICVLFFAAPITSIFFGAENEFPKDFNGFFS